MSRPSRRAGHPAGGDACRAPGVAGERGSAGVLTALGVLVLTTAAGIALLLTACLIVRAQAAAAADLAALAGAESILEGPHAACARAATVVRANGARMEWCEAPGEGVRLEVSVPAPPALGRFLSGGDGSLHARSRAELVGGSGQLADGLGGQGRVDG